jgi:hypothetical protein
MRSRKLHQTHADFRRRIGRVDPAFQRGDASATTRARSGGQPVGALLFGFGAAYVVTAVAKNRPLIESSLRAGDLPERYHAAVFMGLSALLAAAAILLALHVLRFIANRRGQRRGSGATLLGVAGAMALFHTPAGFWDTGYGMLDAHSRSLLNTASSHLEDTLPGIDFAAASFASSAGQ